MSHNQHSTSFDKNDQLKRLLALIEAELNWGPSEQWSGTDFEMMSDLIFEKTQQRLSVTTLKRTWGRTSQNVKPSKTTLDILTQYIAYQNWRDFQSSYTNQEGVQRVQDFAPSMRNIFYVSGGVVLGVVALFMALSLMTPSASESQVVDPTSVSLGIHKVTQGIPNTVVFKYNLSGIVADSIELQQSWDERRRMVLDPSDSLITATYFYPGYFKTKLVADGQIIIEEDLYIPSDGLNVMVFLNGEDNPRQLPERYWSTSNGIFELENNYKESFSGQQQDMMLIGNLMEEPRLDPDNFNFDLSFRVKNDDEGDPCHPISLILTGTEDVYMFRIGHPGCAGQFNTYLGGDYVDGQHVDLSFMGFEEDQWIDVQLSKSGNVLDFNLGDQITTLSDSVNSIGLVGGARLYTSQALDIRKFVITDANQSIDLIQYPFQMESKLE